MPPTHLLTLLTLLTIPTLLTLLTLLITLYIPLRAPRLSDDRHQLTSIYTTCNIYIYIWYSVLANCFHKFYVNGVLLVSINSKGLGIGVDAALWPLHVSSLGEYTTELL